MLWLALHLPRLPLEALASPPESTGFAVVSRERIVTGNDTAISAGIVPAMKLADAWARLPQLAVRERDEKLESAALVRLACRTGAFTSEVSLNPPHGLLLELSGSLRLFGGVEALHTAVLAGCREQGFSPQAALAPTPLAAEWLALGNAAGCTDTARLASCLAPLPLTVLALPEAETTRLTTFGARTLGDVLNLPRAGLARRLGAGLALRLGRALGEIPDPRPRFAFPEHFTSRIELPGPVGQATALVFATRRLIASLCGWLAARLTGIRTIRLAMEHDLRTRPDTLLDLGFAGPTRDPERIVRVLIERLQTLSLPSPVTAIRLAAESPERLTGRTATLLGSDGHNEAEGDQLAALVEQLQVRLGHGGIHGLASAADYRPELASRPLPPLSFLIGTQRPPARQHPPPRPLWLLPRPQALVERAGYPQHHGPLRLLTGPERIESGWWDGGDPGALGDLRRDYFIALSSHAEWLWIFRSPDGWFLHGRFA